jgi:hypothetical protein
MNRLAKVSTLTELPVPLPGGELARITFGFDQKRANEHFTSLAPDEQEKCSAVFTTSRDELFPKLKEQMVPAMALILMQMHDPTVALPFYNLLEETGGEEKLVEECMKDPMHKKVHDEWYNVTSDHWKPLREACSNFSLVFVPTLYNRMLKEAQALGADINHDMLMEATMVGGRYLFSSIIEEAVASIGRSDEFLLALQIALMALRANADMVKERLTPEQLEKILNTKDDDESETGTDSEDESFSA